MKQRLKEGIVDINIYILEKVVALTRLSDRTSSAWTENEA